MQISNRARLLGGTIIAGFMSVSLVACGGGDKQETAGTSQAPALVAPQIGSVTKGEVDVDSLLSFLPEAINVAYADAAYDQGSGMTTLSDLKVTFGDTDGQGLSIETLKIAGFDEDFLRARIAGTNFDQSAVIIDHFEAQNLSLFGMEQFYEGVTDAYLETVNELTEEAIGEDIPDIEQSIDKLEYVIEQIVIDDFELLPFELFAPREGAGGEPDEDFATLQRFATFYRAIGAKGMSMIGASSVIEMTQDGQPMSMNMDVPKVSMRDWRGGDYGYSSVEGMTFDMKVSLPEEDDVPFESMDMSAEFASYSLENLRLDKAMRWLSRGEMPPTTETDLMSLGVWKMQDMTFNMFGAPFYSVESSVTDMSEFHWFVPTRITQKTENLVYDFGALFETLSDVIPELQEGGPEAQEMFLSVLEIAKEYDLSAPSMDLGFKWLWNPDTGAGSFSMDTGLDGYGTMTFDMSGAIANFQRWVDEASVEERSEEQLEALMAETANLAGLRFEMDDRGGNDRLFDAAIALGEALKDISPEAATLAAYDKDTLKLLLASSIKGGAELGAAEFPPIRDYASALADYLTEGGKFAIALEPDAPLSMETVAKLDQIDAPSDIEPLLEEFGFSVTYEPN